MATKGSNTSNTRKIKMVPDKALGGSALSRRLYRDLLTALLEIIFNGLDAANLRGVVPVIEVFFWDKGKHPLSPNGSAISVRDNGTGFTAEVIERYCRVGKSAHTGRVDIHGKHGVGKLAAFALGPRDNASFFILTQTEGNGDACMWRIDEDIFNEDGFDAKPIPKNVRVLLPQAGPFTEIFIPDASLSLKPDEVRTQLTNLLPIRDWVVNVEGKPVQKRQFTAQTVVTSPPVKQLGGAVKFEFAVAEVTAEADGVDLVDIGSGRIVGDLNSLPPSVKRRLDPVLLNARLMGRISAPGLESESAASRTGLSADFWNDPRGERLVAVMNGFGAPEARKLIGEHVNSGKLSDAFKALQDAFKSVFGAPEPNTIFGTDGGGSGGGGGGGGGGRPPRPPVKGQRGKPLGVWVKVEGTTYEVMSFDARSSTPAHVRKGTVLVIDTAHPEVQRMSQHRGARLIEGLVHISVEAHVAATREAFFGQQLLQEVYKLKEQVMSVKK